MENQSTEAYSTRDIYLAATLLSLHFHMVNIDYQIEGSNDRPVGYFAFEKTSALETAIDNFWQGDLAVEPRGFVSNLKSLKAQVNTVYKSPHTDRNSFRKNIF